MGRTLLIGNPSVTWREWLKTNRRGRDLICLDPADPNHSTLARLTLFRRDRPVSERFYGSLDPMRSPHVLVAALAQMLALAEGDVVIQSFAYRARPVMRQTLSLIAQLAQPNEILVAQGTEIDQGGFPVGPVEVNLDGAFPAMVVQAQRKAQWMKLFETCATHHVDLRDVTVEGGRLGSGGALTHDERRELGLGWTLHAEASGGSLFVVAEREAEPDEIARALDMTHATQAHFARPDAYENLLCGFARQDGEDFGLGVIRRVDWSARTMEIEGNAIPPAPVRILRLGGLKVSPKGAELGEVRPWSV